MLQYLAVTPDPLDALIVDLLAHVAGQDRSYEEVIDAWRTSCPRLPVWEEANARGFLRRERRNGIAAVCLTELGRAFLLSREGLLPGRDTAAVTSQSRITT
ncbi:MAG: 3-phosphoglycerate dehydrogenase [Alphaproteobacteria bacterium]|nr:3-phosphoglycerate dehydrogenase [Alphaproteobacteria bacterium]